MDLKQERRPSPTEITTKVLKEEKKVKNLSKKRVTFCEDYEEIECSQ